MFEQIAKIIETAVGDGFTGEDYDRGWNDALKLISGDLANCFKSENRFLTTTHF